MLTSGFLSVGTATLKVIASGVIAADKSYHLVGGEGATTDDLTTITGGTEGDILILRNDGGQTITYKHGAAANNMALTGGADYVSTSSADTLMLLFAGSLWLEVGRGDI